MEKNDKAEELINSISGLESMEEVPAEVSVRFHETLSRLSSQESKKSSMLSRFTGANQFALAASFVLVFALGAVVTLSSGNNSVDPLGVVKPQSSASPSSTDISDDQIQYSGGDKSIPASSPALVKQTASLKEYTEIPMDFYKKLGVGSTWNSAANLDKVILECLKKLELTDSTNLIDSGIFKGKSIKAIWVPITGSSWNVYLIDSSCVALDKKFVQG
jgi:hypothetical protein